MMDFVVYYRTSTGRQNLGIEAQRRLVNDYISSGNHSIVAEYVEQESGRNNKRPELNKAIMHSKQAGATLLIARLDRLSRSVHFISGLLESKIDFIACDMPHATKFNLHIIAAVAEYEADLISLRTRQALAALKAKGVKLGPSENNRFGRRQQALAFSKSISHLIHDYSLITVPAPSIATWLNENGYKTRTGKLWTGPNVRRVLNEV